MALERQTDFTGGLNTRIPAHKLPENMVQSAKNVDFSHGDIRPDTGIGGDGGGQKFYYEKGASWVGTDVVNAYDILTIDAGATTSENISSCCRERMSSKLVFVTYSPFAILIPIFQQP